MEASRLAVEGLCRLVLSRKLPAKQLGESVTDLANSQHEGQPVLNKIPRVNDGKASIRCRLAALSDGPGRVT